MDSFPIKSNNNKSVGTRPGSGPWLHRYSCLLAFCTLLLIAAGGMVTSTGSGLSVPDWPTTYGENMFLFPPSKWVGGIFYEHGHRLIASTVGFLTIILAVSIHRVEQRRWMRRLGWIALAVVIMQGILGGMTVKFNLPTWISVFHACLAQSFFCLTVSIAVFTSRLWMDRPGRAVRLPDGRMRAVAVSLLFAVFLQLFLGALMRHTHSGLAVPDFPLAYGKLLPGLTEADLLEYNHQRAFDYLHLETPLAEVTAEQVFVHMLHRAGAVFVALVTVASVIAVVTRTKEGLFRGPIILAAIIMLLQIGLGAWTIWSGRVPWIATAHVATGALLLATAMTFALRVFGFSSVSHQLRESQLPANVLTGAAV